MSMRGYLALLVCVLAVVISGLLASGKVLLSVELLSRYYPYRAYPPMSGSSPFIGCWGITDSILGSFPPLAYIHQALRSGSLPLWNPMIGLGVPAAGSLGMGYLFPIHWLTYGLLPPLWAWHVELVMIVLLSGLSSYALFHRFSGDAQAATLGATAWTFGGWSAAYLQLPSYSWALALFPFILLGLERANEDKPWAHLQIGLGVASLLLVGHLQMNVPALGMALIWLFWRAPRARLGGALAMLLGGLMASIHLIPLIELLASSERERIPLNLLLNALLLPREFLCMIFPTLMGQPSDNLYFGSMLASPVINGREHCVFAGVVTLLLAGLAAWRRCTRASLPLATLAAGGLLLAGAPWLYQALCTALPPMLYLTPTRFLPFALFIICLLAAQGWASLRQHPLSRKESWTLLGVLAFFVAGALYFIIPASLLTPGFENWLFEMARVNYAAKPPNFEGDFGLEFLRRVREHFSLTSPAIAVSFLVVSLCAVGLARRVGQRLPFRPVLAVLILDLVMFCTVMNVPSPAAMYFPPNPDTAYLAQYARMPQSGQPARPPLRVMSLGDGPYPNLLLVEGIANLEAYESAFPADFRTLITSLNQGYVMGHQEAVYVGHERLGEGVLDILGIGTLYNPPGKWDARYGPPSHQGGIEAVRREPLRAFLLNRYTLTDRSQAQERIMSPGFDPRQEALLDRAPDFPSAPEARFRTVEPTLYSAQRVTFQVSSDHPTLLVLTDLAYSGWTVRVNGHKRPLLKAYGFARAVELASGQSEVEFTFSPLGFPYTPWLAAASFLLLLGYSLGRRWCGSPTAPQMGEQPA
jgi:hypothetical protein